MTSHIVSQAPLESRKCSSKFAHVINLGVNVNQSPRPPPCITCPSTDDDDEIQSVTSEQDAIDDVVEWSRGGAAAPARSRDMIERSASQRSEINVESDCSEMMSDVMTSSDNDELREMFRRRRAERKDEQSTAAEDRRRLDDILRVCEEYEQRQQQQQRKKRQQLEFQQQWHSHPLQHQSAVSSIPISLTKNNVSGDRLNGNEGDVVKRGLTGGMTKIKTNGSLASPIHVRRRCPNIEKLANKFVDGCSRTDGSSDDVDGDVSDVDDDLVDDYDDWMTTPDPAQASEDLRSIWKDKMLSIYDNYFYRKSSCQVCNNPEIDHAGCEHFTKTNERKIFDANSNAASNESTNEKCVHGDNGIILSSIQDGCYTRVKNANSELGKCEENEKYDDMIKNDHEADYDNIRLSPDDNNKDIDNNSIISGQAGKAQRTSDIITSPNRFPIIIFPDKYLNNNNTTASQDLQSLVGDDDDEDEDLDEENGSRRVFSVCKSADSVDDDNIDDETVDDDDVRSCSTGADYNYRQPTVNRQELVNGLRCHDSTWSRCAPCDDNNCNERDKEELVDRRHVVSSRDCKKIEGDTGSSLRRKQLYRCHPGSLAAAGMVSSAADANTESNHNSDLAPGVITSTHHASSDAAAIDGDALSLRMMSTSCPQTKLEVLLNVSAGSRSVAGNLSTGRQTYQHLLMVPHTTTTGAVSTERLRHSKQNGLVASEKRLSEMTETKSRIAVLKQRIRDVKNAEEKLIRELEVELDSLNDEQHKRESELKSNAATSSELKRQLMELLLQASTERNETQVEIATARRRLEEAELRHNEALKSYELCCSSVHTTDNSASETSAEREGLKALLARERETLDTQRRLFDDLDFHLLELELRREEQREPIERKLSQENEKLAKSRREIQGSLLQISKQKQETLSQAKADIADLERERHLLIDAFRKERARMMQLKKEAHEIQSSTRNGSSSCSNSNKDDGQISDEDILPEELATADELICRTPPLSTRFVESLAIIIEQRINKTPNIYQTVYNELSDDSDVSENMSVTNISPTRHSSRSEENGFMSESDKSTAASIETGSKKELCNVGIEEANPVTEQFLANANLPRISQIQQSRPMTRYLPVRDRSSCGLDLQRFIESSGHNVDENTDVRLSSTSCKGFLEKMGGAKFRTTWNRRWFVFSRSSLSVTYFTDSDERKCRGVFKFSDIRDVFVDHVHAVKSPDPQRTFCLKTTARTFYFVAPSPEAMRIWIDVFFTGAEGYQEFI